MTDTVEGTAAEIGTDLEHAPEPMARPTALAVTPQVNATELVERLDVIRQAMNSAMTADVDYGVIPGTNKPTLLKPGSEKLAVLFQLDVQLVNEKAWGPGDHLTVMSHATVFHAPSGARMGYGEGLCTTREKKYGKRKQERVCPTCGAPAVIKGKADYGGGWLCWKKRDGCGAKFPEGDPAIEGQEVGEIDNPELPDLWNTVVKMAEKRARIDAVLAVTGASALFTQDAEDLPPAGDKPPSGHQRGSSGPREGGSDITPVEDTLLTPQMYEQVKAAFAAAGRPVSALSAWMDDESVAADDDLAARISSLRATQAVRLIDFLRSLTAKEAA